MSEPREPKPVKLFVAMLYSDPEVYLAARKRLEEIFGPAEMESEAFEFNHTAYYNREMGEGLRKNFIAFDKPVRPENLPEIKLQTNRLEKEFSREGKRIVNLDPGYLTLDRVILATGKDAAHRVYMGRGVYADVQLIYRSTGFHPLPWTYPDYRAPSTVDFFNRLRRKCKDQRKGIIPMFF